MSAMESEADETLLEECIDELEAAVDKLDRFPAFVIAFAMRAHLVALLLTLRVSDQIGDREIRDFVSGMYAGIADPAEEPT